jgi:glycosyltransferase involved in cell wall biosynthesis
MKIAILAPPWIPVSPPGYGGIEQVVELLSAELVERGHEVTMYAARGRVPPPRSSPPLGEPHPESVNSSPARSSPTSTRTACARDLYACAAALLMPIRWAEPFGLVTTEAMACGTPVIARPCGSVPEVVVDGRTGFLADSLVDLTAAVKRLDEIDRAECRRLVETRFSVATMGEEYERVYRRLGARRRAA